jgi:UDP-N-acetylglucosamine 2-epimerase (non-hydrolysing)
VDSRENLSQIMEALASIAERLPVIVPLHPRTRKTLHDFGLLSDGTSVQLIEPLGYLDFLRLFSGARLVLTDSGGIQEETTVLGIPCLTLRDNTERPITMSVGTNRLVGRDRDTIISAAIAAVEQPRPTNIRVPPLWDGHTAERIVSCLADSNYEIRDSL